jgi:hypothetical protein
MKSKELVLLDRSRLEPQDLELADAVLRVVGRLPDADRFVGVSQLIGQELRPGLDNAKSRSVGRYALGRVQELLNGQMSSKKEELIIQLKGS